MPTSSITLTAMLLLAILIALWMPMRIKEGLAETTSKDGGVTWSTPVRSAIEGPGSRFHVRRLRPGRLLMINHVASHVRALSWISAVTSDREILFAITNETDIAAGNPGPATKLRQLINKATAPRWQTSNPSHHHEKHHI
jgi:hypothetical protein